MRSVFLLLVLGGAIGWCLPGMAAPVVRSTASVVPPQATTSQPALDKTILPGDQAPAPLPDNTALPQQAPPPTPGSSQPTVDPAQLLPEAPEKTQQSMSRAQMARLLVEWFGLSLEPTSVFPVFVDVPLTHPDYAAIDRVRRLHLMLADKGGYFHPDQPATRLDAWMALAKLLFPKNMTTDEEAYHILATYPGQQLLAPYEKKRVARLFTGKVLSPARDVPIEPETPIDAGWMQATLTQLQANRKFIKEQEKQQAASETPAISLPAGLQMPITPSQAIAVTDIALGAQYYFQVLQSVQLPDGTTIPTDSSLKGTVVKAVQNDYTFAFDTLVSSQTGQLYKLKAELTVQLQAMDKGNLQKPEEGNSSLLITGSRLMLVTQAIPAPPAMEQAPSLPADKALPTPPKPAALPTTP